MARRQVSIFINGREVENTLKGIRSEKRKINRELQNMVIGSDEYVKKAKELEEINGKLDNHRRKIGQVDSTLSKITGGLTKFAGVAVAAFSVEAIVSFGKQIFSTNVQMEQLNKKAATVFGQALPQITAEAERNAAAMGFTAGEYTTAATALGDLLIPMGFTRQEAAANSIEMINLAGALSEWSGGQRSATEVSQTLAKALTGEREELKSLGIVISEEDVKMRLRAKGLEGLTGQYLQQAKALATLELITERSVDAQTAYAENSDTLARRQAELTAKIQDMQDALAVALLPALEKVFSTIEASVEVFSDLSKAIGLTSLNSRSVVDDVFAQQDAFSSLSNEVAPLLDRYDALQTKAQINSEEQKELGTLIERIAQLTPTAITEIDNYGNALSISSDKSRDFLDQERKRLEFVNKDAIEEIRGTIQALTSERDILLQSLERGGRGLFNVGRSAEQVRDLQQEIADLSREADGAQAQLERLLGGPASEGERRRQAEMEAREAQRLAQQQAAAEEEAAEEEATKLREKAAEKRAKELRRQLERLSGVLEKAREEEYLATLSDDERALEQIRLKYEKQIAVANELENAGFQQATAQRLELERLRDTELKAYRDEAFATRLEEDAARDAEENAAALERQLKFDEERRALENEIMAQVNEVVLEERELAILRLQEHYDSLILQAQAYGVDVTALELARRQELEEINKDFDEKEQKNREDAQRAQIESAKSAYRALGSVVSAAYNDLLTEQEQATGVGKLLALINIGVNSAEAISSAAAAAAGVPFPGNLAAIATSVGTVLSAMGQARRALNATPDVPQRKEGGWAIVRGEDDGQTYSAKHYGRPRSGMLPSHPVLIDSVVGTPILASERGAEYFVAHDDLRNPAVFRHVAAIDALTARQRVEGGFSTADATAPDGLAATVNAESEANIDPALFAQLSITLNELTTLLRLGIFARLDDDVVIDIQRRLRELNAASGGALN